MKAIVKVRLKDGILDPQGKAVNNALHHLGYSSIRDVRIGKYIELELDETDSETAHKTLEEASRKLLANPVIENFEIQIIKGE